MKILVSTTVKILVSTSWNTACGIADHSAQAMEAIHAVDSALQFTPSAEALDPDWVLQYAVRGEAFPCDVLWLNYHRGLHSRWTPERVRAVRDRFHVPVVITWHDSYGEAEPDQLTRDLHDIADAFIVHEPCLGLPRAHVIRQGVAAWPGQSIYDQSVLGWTNGRPILGTCGFNFAWKNFDRLAAVTAEAGWAFLVLSNNASTLDEAKWRSSNPHTQVVRGFLSTGEIVQKLAGCDATVFAYECANSGTSGAIRLGLAARKPVIAFRGCRQFRDITDIQAPNMLSRSIRWTGGFEFLPLILGTTFPHRVDPGIVALATRDSWANQAAKYAAIFNGLAR